MSAAKGGRKGAVDWVNLGVLAAWLLVGTTVLVTLSFVIPWWAVLLIGVSEMVFAVAIGWPLPRWIHRLTAYLGGYFWLPCPICGAMFGGHEWRDRYGRSSAMTQRGMGLAICPTCTRRGLGGPQRIPSSEEEA